VAGNLEVNQQSIRGQWIVPVEALARVNEGGVFLSEMLGVLMNRPTFDEAAFPLAPADWPPPFPYARGTVRWPNADWLRETQLPLYYPGNLRPARLPAAALTFSQPARMVISG
jgi:hypothetical protein